MTKFSEIGNESSFPSVNYHDSGPKQLMRKTDESAKSALVHLTAVYRTATAMCSHKEVAEDMVQITFAKAFECF